MYGLAASKSSTGVDAPNGFVSRLGNGSRICFSNAGGERLIVLDTSSGSMQQVAVQLPLRDVGESFAIAPDQPTIYDCGRREEADVRVVERK